MDAETSLLRRKPSGLRPRVYPGRSVARTFRWRLAGRTQSQARGDLRGEGLAGLMFVDNNVLVKARILEAPDHEAARASMESTFEKPEPLHISRQVLREYLAVVTRPQTWPVAIARADALDDVERLAATFEVLEDGPVVTDRLVSLCRQVPGGGRQIHDGNIVATMLAYGERRLLTFNVADFRRYADRIELVAV